MNMRANEGAVFLANRTILDAMIRRADFAMQAESSTLELGDKLTIGNLSNDSPITKLLRKPDFQRETNHWRPEQVADLVESFAKGELIPALILWKSDAYVFVIDGGHRLSALRAWMENDYGAGPISRSFFGPQISRDQIKRADQTRKLVEAKVGRFSDLKSLTDADMANDPALSKTYSTVFTRSLHVQWIQGSQEVAEDSFFKINTQGTALDTTEELLLKHRKRSYAIAARAVVRSGQGHKYWSQFADDPQERIETTAQAINDLLFQPDLEEPIKTLDLPLGGTSSPVDALKMLVDIFSFMDGQSSPARHMPSLPEDDDGSETVGLLKRAYRLSERLSGNSAPSLGLHPAVYFYTERGKHSRILFLGTVKCFADKIRNNNKNWFQDFTRVRAKLEDVLVKRKALISQGLSNLGSNQRIGRFSDLIDTMVSHFNSSGEEFSDEKILAAFHLTGKAGDLTVIDAPVGFSDTIKSALKVKASIEKAHICPICGGYVDINKSVSFDHIVPVQAGGKGTIQNADLVHPFCNTGIKGGNLSKQFDTHQ